MMSVSSSARNRLPFTAIQWQELEHQALIYKYMVSGVPIPPELIYSVKRSLDSSLASIFLPHQPIGWGGFQVGFGRQADPEPGRCRRTDGKKWRCSKEAHPDSKYCERHMHRGRNRSRKPVELSSASSSLSTTKKPFTTPSPPIHSPSSMASDQNNTHFNPRPPGSLFPQNTTTNHMFLDSADKRCLQGIRERVDERVFFPETSGTTTSSSTEYYNCTNSSYGRYCQPQLQSSDDNNTKPLHHYFVLGNDFRSIKIEKESETQKPLRHFFEEWPPKSTDSWLDLASTSSRLGNDQLKPQ